MKSFAAVLGSLAVLMGASLYVGTYLSRRDHAGAQAAWVCGLARHAPLGEPDSCRSLGRDIHVIGHAEISWYLLAHYPTGPATLRVDFSDTSGGWRETADAFEVDPSDALALSPAERSAVTAALATRGGLHRGPWTVLYGDG